MEKNSDIEKVAKKNQKPNTYEKNISQLETIVEKMESGNLSLEESMKLFEQGVNISAKCTQMIDSAQTKIDVLFEQQGVIKTKPFQPTQPD